MIIIKKYKNRKLYNTTTHKYITNKEVIDLIKEGKDLQILNHLNVDITVATLLASLKFATFISYDTIKLLVQKETLLEL